LTITGSIFPTAVIIKSFADGRLPFAKTILYSATKTCEVEVTYVNTALIPVEANLYILRVGSASRHLIPVGLRINPRSLTTCDEISMSAGDSIEGDASIAGVVDYTIEGIEG